MSQLIDNMQLAVERVAALAQGKPAPRRSSKWPAFRRKYMADSCAVCGCKTGLNLHHIKPVHLGGAELDPANVITLGEACPTGNHHLLFGHLGDWKAENPQVVADSSTWQSKIKNRRAKP